MPTVRASPEQLRWTLFQSAPAALSLPESGLAASSAVTTQLCGQVITVCFHMVLHTTLPPAHYPKATLLMPKSVNNIEVPYLFNDCLVPGVFSQFLCCNKQTAGTKHQWFFLGMVMI